MHKIGIGDFDKFTAALRRRAEPLKLKNVNNKGPEIDAFLLDKPIVIGRTTYNPAQDYVAIDHKGEIYPVRINSVCREEDHHRDGDPKRIPGVILESPQSKRLSEIEAINYHIISPSAVTGKVTVRNLSRSLRTHGAANVGTPVVSVKTAKFALA